MDVCDEKATVLSRTMMIKAKNTLLNASGLLCGQRDLFSASASSASVDQWCGLRYRVSAFPSDSSACCTSVFFVCVVSLWHVPRDFLFYCLTLLTALITSPLKK